ncbi:hypothetical protein [Tessaracoccus coleopterorum]|nr:hypothetical protein [Tessaracoccus coleopterorum]
MTAPDLTDDQATVMLPAIDDTPTGVSDEFDDIGPVTIVRNRPR